MLLFVEVVSEYLWENGRLWERTSVRQERVHPSRNMGLSARGCELKPILLHVKGGVYRSGQAKTRKTKP
ncbi:hypothetical protein SAMN05444955_12041 [Lihuaxuella thermophila]|uniref:Uncharacterized protein n=1 Tax=Lihuaxuella thermophila TaxID=1173111 RepID=A0A1H8J0U5_9BACL|nr:hypothetical protein SAMN05444955_12041 [Lihuaxuella thermophila]